ncbi:MAG: amidophosphoribosyltransferase, partial [Candidatus Paceibacterota bacterium]
YVFASETCAFHPIGATYIRDVEPGEMVVIDENGLRIKQIMKGDQKLDIFEFVYFSRPDSILLGQTVYDVRKRFGEQLAREYKIDADVIIPVPETAIPVAIGYSNLSGIPLEIGLIKSRYIHRTFIEPEQHIRDQGVKLKLAPLKNVIENKKIIIVDDSIVRGTTSKQLVKILFETGAKEVHFLVSSPPVKYPDFYGIDLPVQRQLISAGKTIEEVRDFLGCTSLSYLSFDGMIKSTNIDKNKFCTSCFSGEYPIDISERKNDFKL